MKRFLKISITITFLAALVTAGFCYFQYTALYPSTDDAYVQANITHIAPRVSGMVSDVYVKDLQHVRKGQPLFDIDNTPYALAVLKAKANLDLARQNTKAAASSVKAARALVNERQANLIETEKTTNRIVTLVSRGLYAQMDGDVAIRKLNVAKAELNAANDQLDEAKQKLGETGPNNPNIRSAETALSQALLNQEYTHVVSPSDGYIAKFTLRQGSEVSAYEQLFAIIDENNWWTTANFKETQLSRIHNGQVANITVDMYPNHIFKGRVIQISEGSGESFSILPAENATGNWVKVTQRFPVKVAIIDNDPQYPLRMGASSKVTIDTVHTR